MSRLISLDTGKYTVVPDNIIRDKDLDLKSRGMLLTLLNLAQKPNWDFSEKGLKKILNKEGRESIHNTLVKLEKAGYLQRNRRRGVDGILLPGIDYIVSTQRQTDFTLFEITTYDGKADIGENEPMTAFPTQDKPIQVYPTQYEKGVKNGA